VVKFVFDRGTLRHVFMRENRGTKMSASDAMAACWPEAVPRDYNDMEKKYGAFVASLVTRYNKVGRNFRDLHHHIWMKLLEADVIQKYMDLIETQVPKTMTAVQACAFLGINFNQWRTAMWAFHKQDPVYDKTGVEIGRRQGHWMPTPINLAEFQARGLKGYSAKTALFDFEDILKLASDEKVLKNGNVRGAFAKSGPIQLEGPKATKSHFQAYLARAIHNTFANWCRTTERRHKERPADMFSQFRPQVDDPTPWESRLEDTGAPCQETLAALHEAKARISSSLVRGMRDVPSCKPVEDHEGELFTMLEEGYTLQEVVKRLDIPDRVRRAVLNSVAPSRP
jgi:hypothetical protein